MIAYHFKNYEKITPRVNFDKVDCLCLKYLKDFTECKA